jgi:uncharacterized protein (TIGR03435 family)
MYVRAMSFATGVILSAFFVIAPALLIASPGQAQSPVQPSFEVASVRRVPLGTGGGMSGGPGTSDPERIAYTNVVLHPVLAIAYGEPVFGPDWLDSERYDIMAKVPAGATKEEANLMMRDLLVRRFGLALHHESKDFPGYELTVAKNGPKLREWFEGPDSPTLPPLRPQESASLPRDRNGFPHLPAGRSGMAFGFTGTGRTHVEAGQQTIAGLATWLGSHLNGPVIDKTELSGKYSFTLEFELEGDVVAQVGDLDDAGGPAPSLFGALQQQLGLKLEEKKLRRDVLVIDHIEKVPTEN